MGFASRAQNVTIFLESKFCQSVPVEPFSNPAITTLRDLDLRPFPYHIHGWKIYLVAVRPR